MNPQTKRSQIARISSWLGHTSPAVFFAAACSLQVGANTQVGVLLEPPMPVAAGSAGDAATNQGQSLSADGRFVVFTSYASNLVEGDTNGARDVFLWDTQTNVVERINRGAAVGGVPEQANGDSSDAVISADGNWVAFSSTADNLALTPAASDTNGATNDVFLYGRISGQLQRVSQSTAGQQSATPALRPDINANGRYVTFDTAGALAAAAGETHRQVFRRDRWSNRTELVSQTTTGTAANGLSMDAQMSADGERVVFVSMATNLSSVVTVGKESYLRDMPSNSTQLLALNAAGEAGDGISYFPSISGDGKFAAFHSNASNLVANDAPGFADVILRDLTTGALELISRNLTGPSVEAANDFSIHPSLSYNGNRVLFATNASNLVAGDDAVRVDVVLADRALGQLSLLSQNDNGTAGNGDSAAPSLSYDGRHASFETRANNLTVNGTAFSDAVLARLDPNDAPRAELAAAVLPSSRSVLLGESLTAFASVISTELASDCTVALAAPASGAQLQQQATNPVTNVTVGTPNSPFLLLPDVPQSLLLTLTPEVAVQAQEIEFQFSCANGAAPVVLGTNTLLVSADTVQPADVVALAATLDNNGIVSLPEGGGAGFFTVATVNLGASAAMRVRPQVLGVPLSGVSVCQTNPATSECLAPAASVVTATVNSGTTPTFAVFLSHTGSIPFAPAKNRLVLQFEDAGGVVRGRTSVAVRTLGF